MKRYPALDVDSTSELLLALVDDCSPTAVEPRGTATRLFFASPEDRATAAAALQAAGYRTHRLEVDDEDWARRSQADLEAITVGRIRVAAPWHSGTAAPGTLTIVIVPSMGFGTGHHATTRLCLEALQSIELRGRRVLDVGTGSGVLAIAAAHLGAASALGVDNDPDAIQSAEDNLALNPEASNVAFETRDATTRDLPSSDVITANLTGTLLVRLAGTLARALKPGGTAILSGILTDEREAVRTACSALTLAWERADGEWLGLMLKKT